MVAPARSIGLWWLPATLAVFGVGLVLTGVTRRADDRAVRDSAVAFVQTVAEADLSGRSESRRGRDDGAFDLEVISSRVDGNTAVVRVLLRDGENTLRAEVRMLRTADIWKGRTISFPDLGTKEARPSAD